MEMKIKLRPWIVPNYVIAIPQIDGLPEPKWHIKDVDEKTLAELCNQFRHDVFTKAGKVDPEEAGVLG